MLPFAANQPKKAKQHTGIRKAVAMPWWSAIRPVRGGQKALPATAMARLLSL